jgi:hypothetical protein
MRGIARPVLGRGALAAAALAAFACVAPASAQLRVATYNVVQMNGDPVAVRTVLAAMHADDRQGFATAVGVFVFNEVSQPALAALQTAVNGAAPAGITYALATYTTSSTENGSGGARACFYRTDLLSEIPSGHVDIATGGGRNTDRWLFQLNGYSSTAARFYVYGSHLKASTGSANVAERLSGVQAIRANADALGAGVRAIYAGDMNFYTNNESGFQAYVAPGNGAAVDPLGTADWTGAANAWKHTQSPRTILADGLVGGGMDDRFDLVLPTLQLADGNGISSIASSCRAVGNDGNHFDQAVNAGNNTYFPGNVARSNALANALHDAADHIPVLMDFTVPAWNTAVLGTVPARVVQGATATAEVRVANDAPGDNAVGVDALDYTVAGTGVLSGTLSGTAVLTPSFTSVNVPIVTTTVGLRTGTATVTSANEAVQNPSIALPVSVRVLRASNPSFSSTADANSTTVTFAATLGGPAVDVAVPVSNFGFTADQCTMDIDQVQIPAGRFSLVSGTGTGHGATPATVTIRFNPTGLTAGTYTSTATILTSDENIPGATSAQVVATLSATVTGGNPADLNGDGRVDGADLGLLLAAWGTPGPTDLDGSGSTDGADLGILLTNWG